MQIRGTLKLTVATSLEDLLPWEWEWKTLWELSINATPFQSPAWILPYLRVFKPPLFKILFIRRDRRLVAVFPLAIDNSGGGYVLRLLGQGVSDYLDGLCLEDERSEVVRLVELWRADELKRCEYAEFDQLRQHGVLRSIPRPGFFHEESRPGTPCPVAPLGELRTGSTRSLSDSISRNLEASLRQIKKIGRLNLELANEHSLETAVSNLFSLHAKRWQRRGLPGVFESRQRRSFYRHAFRALQSMSVLELFTLSLEQVPIAALAAFQKNGTLYYYIGAFDPDYARFSPGNLIILRAMEFASMAGCHSFDFLRGREPYKYKWGAEDQETSIRRIWR
jgi:CelD/BcsL family acetyltransferase involved in cellulose biosynthesis